MSPTAHVSSSQQSQTPAAAPTSKVDKNMFMQLLVAQLKNQNPLSPTDSMQFVQQLAQYQQLEQTVNTGQDIAAMRQDMDQILAINTGASRTSQT